MKTTTTAKKSQIKKIIVGALALLAAAGCTISGVNTDIFNNANVKLHPCGVALEEVSTVGNMLDGPIAISTYEGDSNPGFVYIWKSAHAFLSSAPLTNRSGKVENMPNPLPDYQITGITDPEGIAFDTNGNLFIAATSPTPTSIYYINMSALAGLAQPDPVTNIPTISASSLKTIAIAGNPVNDTNASDSYGQPRGLTYNTDDGDLYVAMENYNLPDGSNRSTVFQITGPTSGSPKVYTVGNNLSTLGTCLGIAYSIKHKCFFLTDIEQKLHQLSWPKGTKNTTGVNLVEAQTAIPLPGVYAMDVAVSADSTSQDSVFFTTTNALTPSGDLSNPNPQCYLNAVAYSKWSSYANSSITPTLSTLDTPAPYPASFGADNLLVAWGVGVFPYSNTNGKISFYGIIVADAPKSKVVRYFGQ